MRNAVGDNAGLNFTLVIFLVRANYFFFSWRTLNRGELGKIKFLEQVSFKPSLIIHSSDLGDLYSNGI